MKHLWTLIKNFLFGKKTGDQTEKQPFENVPFPYRHAYKPDVEVKAS